MKKKILLILGILLVIAGISFAGVSIAAMNAPKHPSDYHIGITYDAALKSDKPMMIVFYADWCSYCLKFMPKFKILSTIYKDKLNFVMLNAEETAQNTKLAQDYGVSGFPTVYISDPKYDNRVLMPNVYYQDLGRFRVEIDRYIRIRKLLDGK